MRDDAAARVGRCRGKSYLDLLRQRAGDCEDAPDAVVAPGSAAGGAGGPLRVQRGGRGGRAVRRRDERRRRARAAARALRRARVAGPRAPGGPRAARRALARSRGWGRDAAARGRPRAGAARLHARAHAAELRVGDGRRLRGDALGRPVLDRARADRGERRRAALRDAGGRADDAGGAGDGRRAGAQAARDRLGGRAGGDHRASGCGSTPLPATRALRGLVRALLRGRGRGAARARAGRARARRRAPLRRGRDADVAGDGEPGGGPRRSPAARCCARAATRTAAC